MTKRPESHHREFIEQVAHEAGQLALARFGHVRAEAKGASLVSEADRAVERMIVSRIRSRFPGDYILAEESGANGRMCPGPGTRWWAVDPIDGTGPYLAGLPFWSVSIALLRGAEVVSAAVYMAALGQMFSAERGGPALRNGARLACAGPAPAGLHSYLFIPCRPMAGLGIDYPGRQLSLAAASVHLTYAASGAAFGAVVEPNSAYDIAAAALVFTQAGGAVRYLSGKRVDFAAIADGRRMAEPVVAAPEGQLDWLRGRVSWSGA